MTPGNASTTINLISAYGYPALFALIFIEGPAATAAGAFAAALGYMDVYIVFILSLLGNLAPDVLYYAIGFWGRRRVIEKYWLRAGLPQKRMDYLENLLKTHAGKALTIIKLLPILPTPGLMLAGAVRMPIKKYAFWSTVIILPSSIFYLVVGYYFGAAYENISPYVDYGGYIALGLLVVFGFIYYGHRKISKKLAEGMERN